MLDRFTVNNAPRGVLVITKDGGESQRIKASVLKAFVAGGKTDDTSGAPKLMAGLAQGTKGMLYGRKLGAFLIARAA